MEINLERIDDAFKFQAFNETGQIAFVDGSHSIGGSQSAFRPMQLLLLSLVGCSAIDIISILKKQRQRIDAFKIKVKGERKEGVPTPFKSIRVHFELAGKIKKEKLAKAIELSESKYCSVHFSLDPEIDIKYTFDIVESPS